MSDTPATIFRSALRFFSGTMLSRMTGLLRDMAMAYVFGTQSSIAALLVAFRFAHLLRRLFGEGALQTAFIPHFEHLRKESPKRAGAFFQDLSFSLTFFLSAIIAISMGLLGCLYAFGNLSEGNEEIVWLTLLMMPSLLFICLYGLNASLLQCEKNFFASSAAPIAFNLIWIAGVFAVKDIPISQGISYLAGFVVLACIGQWAATFVHTHKILKSYCIGRTRLQVRFSQDVMSLIKPLALGILGIAAAQINNALDAVFARWANDEGPAVLWYAIRLQQLPLALFGIALSGALLPPLSRAVKNGDQANYRTFLDFALKSSIALMLPITLGIFVLGDSCINLIYGHGDFSNSSIEETSWALWGYAIGLAPMALILVLAPAFYSRGDYRTTTIASTASMLVNILLNTAMIAGFGLGAGSIALATSISAWFNLGWLAWQLQKKEGWNLSAELVQSSLGILMASLAAVSAAAVAQAMFWGQSTALELAFGKAPDYQRHLISQLFYLLSGASVFFSVLAAGAYVLKIKDVISFSSTNVRRQKASPGDLYG